MQHVLIVAPAVVRHCHHSQDAKISKLLNVQYLALPAEGHAHHGPNRAWFSRRGGRSGIVRALDIRSYGALFLATRKRRSRDRVELRQSSSKVGGLDGQGLLRRLRPKAFGRPSGEWRLICCR